MKKIKLLHGILVGLLILSSCSSDDDSNSNSSSIIGTWKTIRVVDVCSTGSEEIYDYNSCQQTGRVIFYENGTFSGTGYELTNGNCEQIDSSTGTWLLNGDNLIITTEGEQTENYTLLELTNNILKFRGEFIDPSPLFDTCDGENLVSHYYEELVRVE